MLALPPALREGLEARGRGLSLIVVRLGALGDILRTLPPVRLLRRALPDATIHWVLDERWLPALDGHPELDGLHVLPRGRWRAAARRPWRWPALLADLTGFRAALRGLQADLLLDFHGNLRSGVVGGLSGAPVRIGYDGHQQKEGNRLWTTHQVPAKDRRTSRMERNLELVRALGLPDGPLPVGDLPLATRGSAEAERLLAALDPEGGGLAVINPGASPAQAYKRPPAELLAAAARRLDRRGLRSLVVWGPGEEADAARVVESAGGAARLAPSTALPTLAALLARARLYVGGDTGPLHLACAVGCPVLGLYGPTDPEVNCPWGVPYRVLAPPGRRYTGIKRHDRDGGGFVGLTPAAVEDAVDALLDGTVSADA